MSVNFTEIKISPANEDRLKAYVTITLNNCFVIRDLKIIQGYNGLFVAMPSKRCKDGQFRDVVHPLNQETRKDMENNIFKAYEEKMKSFGKPLNLISKKNR